MNVGLWMMVAGGAGLALLLAARAAFPSPAVEVGERGILDRRLRLGWIGWDEIEGAYQPSLSDGNGLHLKLRPSERLVRRLKRRRRDGGVDVRLDLSRSEMSPAELLHEIMNRSGASAIPS